MHEGQSVSLVTGVMRRTPSLLAVLPTWLVLRELDEIVIVDWGGDASMCEAVRSAGLRDSRLCFYRVPGVSCWEFSACANLGISVAVGERILRTDVDVAFAPGFFADLPLVSDEFWTGYWGQARDHNECHLNGTIYTHRESFLVVNGYNERLVGYGYDDEDLYARLCAQGFGRRFLDHDLMRHLPHGDDLRVSCAPEIPIREDVRLLVPSVDNATCSQQLERSNTYNRKLANVQPWTVQDRRAIWTVAHMDDGFWYCQRRAR
jgi:hypothetical protein